MRIALFVLGLMLVGCHAADKCDFDYKVTNVSTTTTRIEMNIACPAIVIEVSGRAVEVHVRLGERVGELGQGGRDELPGIGVHDEQRVSERPNEGQVQGEGQVGERGRDGVEHEERVGEHGRDVRVKVEEHLDDDGHGPKVYQPEQQGGMQQETIKKELGKYPEVVEHETGEEELGHGHQPSPTEPGPMREPKAQSPSATGQEMQPDPDQTFVKILRILVLFIEVLDQQLEQITRSIEAEQGMLGPRTYAIAYYVRILKEEGLMCTQMIRCNLIISASISQDGETSAIRGSFSSLTNRLEEQSRKIKHLISRLTNSMSNEGTQTGSDTNIRGSTDQDGYYSNHSIRATVTECHYFLQWHFDNYNNAVVDFLGMNQAPDLTWQTYDDDTNDEERKEREANWLTRLINDGVDFIGRGANSVMKWNDPRGHENPEPSEEALRESSYKPQPYEDAETAESLMDQFVERVQQIYTTDKKSPRRSHEHLGPGLKTDYSQENPLIEEINKVMRAKGYKSFTSSDLKMMAEWLNMYVYASNKDLAKIKRSIEEEEVTTGAHTKEELSELMKLLKLNEHDCERNILTHELVTKTVEKLGATATEDYGIIALVARLKESRDQCNHLIERLVLCMKKLEQRGPDPSANLVETAVNPSSSDEKGVCDNDFLNDYYNETRELLEKILGAIERTRAETVHMLQHFVDSQFKDDSSHVDCSRTNETELSFEPYGGINDEENEGGRGNWLTDIIDDVVGFIRRIINWLFYIADTIVDFIVFSISYLKSLVLGQLLQPIFFTAIALAIGLILVIAYPMITTGVIHNDDSNARDANGHVFPNVEVRRREDADTSSDSGMNTTSMYEDEIRQTREGALEEHGSENEQLEQNASEDELLGGNNARTTGLGEDGEVKKKRTNSQAKQTKRKTTSQAQQSKRKTTKPGALEKRRPATNPATSDCQDEFQLSITTCYVKEQFEECDIDPDSDSNEEC